MMDKLIASVKLCNNGYLRFPSQVQWELAKSLPAVFRCSIGSERLIALSGFVPEYYPRKPQVRQYDGPDYEGMILDRQERAMMDY